METTIVTLPPRRSASGAVDVGHRPIHSVKLGARGFRDNARQTAVGLVGLVQRGIKAVRAWRERRAAYRELAALDAQALHDMGVNPGDIDAIVQGRFATDSSRCRKHFVVPLNEPAPAASWRERARPGIRPALTVCPD